MIARRLFILGLASFLCTVAICPAYAQDSASQPSAATDTVHVLSGVEVRTAVDPPSAYIGDPITYTVTITYDSAYELVPSPLGANLGSFDVKDYHADFDSLLADGRKLNQTKFILTTFTTGDYVIPPVPITIKRKDGTRSIFLSEPVPITIKSLLTNTSDTPDIRPLKPLIVVPMPTWYWWAAGGFALLCLGIVMFLLLRKKHLARLAVSQPPWEVAYAQLAALEQQGLVAEGKYREFYGQLTDIARYYLGSLYLPTAPDMTTDEINSWLEIAPRLARWRDSMSAFLRSADLYKFARVQPPTDQPQSDFSYVHALIGELREEHLAYMAAQREAAQLAEKEKESGGTPPATISQSADDHAKIDDSAGTPDEHGKSSDDSRYMPRDSQTRIDVRG